jgi:hypothetical protein
VIPELSREFMVLDSSPFAVKSLKRKDCEDVAKIASSTHASRLIRGESAGRDDVDPTRSAHKKSGTR